MFYKFVGYPPGVTHQVPPCEILLNVAKVTAYYPFGNGVTVIRCDGANFRLTTPFADIHNAIIEGQSLADGLGDTGGIDLGLGARP